MRAGVRSVERARRSAGAFRAPSCTLRVGQVSLRRTPSVDEPRGDADQQRGAAAWLARDAQHGRHVTVAALSADTNAAVEVVVSPEIAETLGAGAGPGQHWRVLLCFS
jgi:hypothetical protein